MSRPSGIRAWVKLSGATEEARFAGLFRGQRGADKIGKDYRRVVRYGSGSQFRNFVVVHS